MRRHLTYANVLATLAAAVVVLGGSAYAASQLAKNSVGSKQLKKNSVTANKIKKNAVTTAKINKASVNGAKVKPGSLSDPDLSTGMPFGRIVAEYRGTATVALPSEVGPKFTSYPLAAPYTQEAGRNDSYVGYADITIAASCETPQVLAFLLVDGKNPTEITVSDITSIAALGIVQKLGAAQRQLRIQIGPYPGGNVRVGPDVATPHTISLSLKAVCASGQGVTVTGAGVDVIGFR
jgi:hypothetical protein